MNSKTIIRAASFAGGALVSGVLLLSVPRAVIAGLPSSPPGPNLPGTIKGTLETYWIWPFVRASRNPDKSVAITWLDEKGNVRRQAKADEVCTGFAALVGPPYVVEGINEDWKITLPPSSDDDDVGAQLATADSRIFLVETTSRSGQVLIHPYVNGKPARTLGPFFQYKGRDIEVEDDFSSNGNDCAGLLIWKDETKTTAQVLVIDADGKIGLRQDCDPGVDGTHAAPDGKGVLTEDNRGGEHENTFLWYTEKGKTQTLKIEQNPELLGWLPHTHRSLFSTSVGHQHHYRLVDWDSGETRWDIPCPGEGHNLAVGIAPDLILLSQAELFKGNGPWMGESLGLPEKKPEWIRVIYAVDAASGEIVASWRADPGRMLPQGRREFFCWAGGKFYFVTPNEFTELDLDDIRAGRNGWVRK